MTTFRGKTIWCAVLFIALSTSPHTAYALDLTGDGEDIVISMEEARENEEEKSLRDIYLETNYPNGLLAASPEHQEPSSDAVQPERSLSPAPNPPRDAAQPPATDAGATAGR